MEHNKIDKIVSVLKSTYTTYDGKLNNTDYMSGVNDGMYHLYRFFFEPYSIPPETRKAIDDALKQPTPLVVEVMNKIAGNTKNNKPSTYP